MVDLVGRLFSGRDRNGSACELFRDLQLIREIMRAERMMEQMVRGPVVAVGRAGHQNDGQILGVSAADRIECRERADAEGDDGSCCTPRPGIALGAEAAVQLVAAIDLL